MLSIRDEWYLHLASFLPLALISMADRPSSTTAKMSKMFLKPFRGLVKRPKSANASASLSNSTRNFVSSASGAHDPVPGKDAKGAERTVSGKYIGSILVLSDSTSLQAAMLP